MQVVFRTSVWFSGLSGKTARPLQGQCRTTTTLSMLPMRLIGISYPIHVCAAKLMPLLLSLMLPHASLLLPITKKMCPPPPAPLQGCP